MSLTAISAGMFALSADTSLRRDESAESEDQDDSGEDEDSE